ncbi:TetR/AcrR family transcriptional regulator [Flavobacterium sp. NST-5]|uniref:TetR/AcrR family transcriptional regulator n=1 Tax=Flavobacterium ichthyis TaxID=2698827 RepID=A0ABW9ZBA5_9FLAO|nr:TetR/AcrR family transcriptional regulator [Flavobacterium ichthyis]NBL64078.1 TetR/AcrR family transcriptional regulator [Flavobacterium ichthyis]
MTVNNKEIWIKKGYEIFANFGKNGLKIEPLAISVGKSKSSFYHHFADLELFMDFLLNYHIQQSQIIANKEKNAQNIDPELIHILVEHKIDLLFNRQLRINQNIPSYAVILEQSNKIIGNAFVNTWVKDLDLQLTEKQIDGIFSLALENFFLQINIETLNYNWLSNYFKNLKTIAHNII